MSIQVDQLVFDPTATANSSNVGAYLRDSAGNLLTSTLSGGKQALDVNVVGSAADGVYNEDATAADGAAGVSSLFVRADTPSSLVTANGGYGWPTMDLYNRTWTNKAANVALLNSVKSVTSTAANLLTANQAGRVHIEILNNSNKPVFIGFDNTVTTTTGMPIPAGGSAAFDAGPAINFFAIVSAGTADVRILEFS